MRLLKPLSVLLIIYLGIIGNVAFGQEETPQTPPTTPLKSTTEVENMLKSYKDGFFKVARFIMTNEEIDIYKHLTNIKDKETFIDDFWKKRDPSPGTDENESKDEFYLRVAFSNKWFQETSKGMGWDTERGRLLLQLGFPDERKVGNYAPTYNGRLVSTKRTRMETWIYYRYHLVLTFAGEEDAASRLSLTSIPSELSAALEKAKFSVDLTSTKQSKHSFKFDASYKTDHFLVSIPIKRVSFEDKNDQMAVDFNVSVYVYRDNLKIDEFKSTKTISMAKDELLKLKNLEFQFPYSVDKKGKYFFDVIIEEKASATIFRDFIKYKI